VLVGAAIWLILLGYTAFWAGWRNWGVSYQAQPDGSIHATGTVYSFWDALTCGPGENAQAAGSVPAQPSTVSVSVPGPAGPVTARVATDCTVRPGDTKIPVPGGYLIWRPNGSGVLGQLNGSLIGPCQG